MYLDNFFYLDYFLCIIRRQFCTYGHFFRPLACMGLNYFYLKSVNCKIGLIFYSCYFFGSLARKVILKSSPVELISLGCTKSQLKYVFLLELKKYDALKLVQQLNEPIKLPKQILKYAFDIFCKLYDFSVDYLT